MQILNQINANLSRQFQSSLNFFLNSQRILLFDKIPFICLLCLFPIFISLPTTLASDVGAISGEFQVSNGSANYIVPIEVPPVIMSGMQPSLYLNYSSGGDNGPLGMGWGLGGLSSVTRFGRTIEQDGFVNGVDLDGDDKFCLEGERLVAINGAYGANGTEYRTEK